MWVLVNVQTDPVAKKLHYVMTYGPFNSEDQARDWGEAREVAGQTYVSEVVPASAGLKK